MILPGPVNAAGAGLGVVAAGACATAVLSVVGVAAAAGEDGGEGAAATLLLGVVAAGAGGLATVWMLAMLCADALDAGEGAGAFDTTCEVADAMKIPPGTKLLPVAMVVPGATLSVGTAEADGVPSGST
jgi:hypothetical protein